MCITICTIAKPFVWCHHRGEALREQNVLKIIAAENREAVTYLSARIDRLEAGSPADSFVDDSADESDDSDGHDGSSLHMT
ncbi:hypothetical protein CVIRNUC_004124 [Coccomyxa viridis]|uniref:Uncharacterized protein n=1 Tax=Coccomyxa viridis TaxID=1274662 RepID=A0AAV1I4U7_9CHLO|nr:hypothetical protein CVIRNUC_004124 [Coccomyxa viridis]